MDIGNVTAFLPHRPPILMIEEVVDIDPGKSGTGRNSFPVDGHFFAGHFPGRPILPGVLIVEALAQTAMVVLRAGDISFQSQKSKDKEDSEPIDQPLGFLAKITNASFHKTIEPGRSIDFQVAIVKKINRFYFVEGQAFDQGELCAKATLVLAH